MQTLNCFRPLHSGLVFASLLSLCVLRGEESQPPPEAPAAPVSQDMVKEMRRSVASIAIKHGAPSFAFVFCSDREMGKVLSEQLTQSAPLIEMEALLAERRQQLASLDKAVAAKRADYAAQVSLLEGQYAAKEADLKRLLDLNGQAYGQAQAQLAELNLSLSLAKRQEADAQAGAMAAQGEFIKAESQLGVVQGKLARYAATAGQISKLMGDVSPGTVSVAASVSTGTPLNKLPVEGDTPKTVAINSIPQEVYGEE